MELWNSALCMLLCISVCVLTGECYTVGVDGNFPENNGSIGSGIYLLDNDLYRFNSSGSPISFHIGVNLPSSQHKTEGNVSLLIIRPSPGGEYTISSVTGLIDVFDWNSLGYEKTLRHNISIEAGDIIGFFYEGINPVAYEEISPCSGSDEVIHLENIAALQQMKIDINKAKHVKVCNQFAIIVTVSDGNDCERCTCLMAEEGVTGEILSPNYPYGYGDDRSECWLIYTESVSDIVTVRLDELNTEGAVYEWGGYYFCSPDFIAVYSGRDDNVGYDLTCWSGLKQDQDIRDAKSEGRYMYITFTSDYSISDGKWALTYTAENDRYGGGGGGSDYERETGVSVGLIVGIVVGSISGVVAFALICCCCCYAIKKAAKKPSAARNPATPMTSVQSSSVPPPYTQFGTASAPAATANGAPPPKTDLPAALTQPIGPPPNRLPPLNLSGARGGPKGGNALPPLEHEPDSPGDNDRKKLTSESRDEVDGNEDGRVNEGELPAGGGGRGGFMVHPSAPTEQDLYGLPAGPPPPYA